MKRHWKDIKFVLIIFVCWFILLRFAAGVAEFMWPLRQGYLGPISWANFDGVHYLLIATAKNYHKYSQAFFPLYPLLIRAFLPVASYNAPVIALVISYISLLFGMINFYLLSKKNNPSSATWSILFLMVFPASFFYGAAYPESLFFCLATGSLLLATKKHYFFSGILGALASATRIFGIFLWFGLVVDYFKQNKRRRIRDIGFLSLVPLGLLSYMTFLWQSVGDPLAFFHVQPAYGASRSGNTLILLPQVIWRYFKILNTVNPYSHEYLIAVFELAAFGFAVILVYLSWRRKLSSGLILYSLAVLITPTLTGTLSSFPRYILAAFPLFFSLGSIGSRYSKILLVITFGLGLIFFASLFLRGYFVA